MTKTEAWLCAAERGSCLTNGDPGACMYGFDETFRVQSEEHRRACLDHIDGECQAANLVNVSCGGADESGRLAELRAMIVDAEAR